MDMIDALLFFYVEITLCYPTTKLLKFSIWQTTSANFLMKQLKNIQSKMAKSIDLILITYKQSCRDGRALSRLQRFDCSRPILSRDYADASSSACLSVTLTGL